MATQKNSTKLNDNVKSYLLAIKDYPRLNQDEEVYYCKKIKEDDIDAKDTFIRCNLKLVVSIAKQFKRYNVPFMDLIQEGNLGLIKAVDKFDHTLGFKFSTYATQWIRQYITRYIMDKCNIIHIPAHILEDEFRIRKIIDHLSKEYQRIPTMEEIMEESGLSKEKILDLLNMIQEPISIDQEIDEEGSTSLMDMLKDDTIATPEEVVNIEFVKESIKKSLDSLDERERTVIIKRFGLDGNPAQTLDQIGKSYGITRERIRQIESKAMRKLKTQKNRGNLEDFFHDLH